MKNHIQIRSNVPASLVLELTALCTDGWVTDRQVNGKFLEYELAPGAELCLMITEAQRSEKDRQIDEINKLDEIVSVILGFFAQGIEVQASGAMFEHSSIKNLGSWLAAEKPPKLDLECPYHKESHLSLNDLIELHHWLSKQEQPIAALERVPQFTETFPLVDIYAGDYSNLRHKSGHEIFMVWKDNKFAERHQIDAPAPSAELKRKYHCWQAGKVYRQKAALNLDKIGPYQKSSDNRRKYAFLLGGLPEKAKPRIFRWLVDISNDLANYHDSRGGQELPELFEIAFDNKVLTATRDLVIRLRD